MGSSTVSVAEPWVDADTVAAHLGFNSDHIRVMARAGKLPGVQMQNGRRVFWRFRLSAVDAYMEQQAREQMSQAVPIVSPLVNMTAQG